MIFIRINILLLITLIATSGWSQTRQVNFTYKIVSPIEDTHVSSPQEIPVAFRLFNQGPDTLWTCDSFASDIVHSLGISLDSNRRKFVLSSAIFPGDSSDIYFDESYVNWTGSGESINLDLSLTIGFIGTDYSHIKGSLLQAQSGDDAGVQRINLIHKKNKVSVDKLESRVEINVYPNPLTGRVLTLKNVDVSSLTHFSLLDIRGRSVAFTQENFSNEQTVKLTVPANLIGLYILVVRTEDQIVTKRVVINN